MQDKLYAGDLPDGRKKISGLAWITETTVGFNFGHVFGIDGTKAEDLTRAAMEGRRLIKEQIQFLRKYVPGFEHIHLVHSGDQIGIRTSLSMAGRFRLIARFKARSASCRTALPWGRRRG